MTIVCTDRLIYTDLLRTPAETVAAFAGPGVATVHEPLARQRLGYKRCTE